MTLLAHAPHRVAALALLLAGAAGAQQVTLGGVMGSKALLVVDGGPPQTVAVGETYREVTVVSVSGQQVVLEVKGQRFSQRVGDAPSSVGGRPDALRGTRIVLHQGSGGHFFSQGQINGRPVQFMVDTGATNVALGVADAERIGLVYRMGQPVQVGTANGVSQAWRISLHSVRIGDVEVFGVEALVLPESMPYTLLGNSFLSRFQMRRDSDQMVLERRY